MTRYQQVSKVRLSRSRRAYLAPRPPASPQSAATRRAAMIPAPALAALGLWWPLVTCRPAAHTDPADYEDIAFKGEEFQYFYNLELVETLTNTGNTTFSELSLDQVAETEPANSTKVDGILDKLLEQGDLIEEVLNEFDPPKREVTLRENSDGEQISFSASIMYEILYWMFFVCFIVMLLFSLVLTGKYFLDNPKSAHSGSPLHNRADLEFVFFPGRQSV